ncbi:MAG: tRNA (adenosine(37)-N6)-dimethylallyltransferase MiaA [Acidobacteriota bacterium]|nr:tRNA (adenosine(37)-N6)-dimethylallyltransferase MiaA [Acidobacteriota bacterium]
MTLPCLAVVGATCTGKSSLAMALAQALDGELINADALQAYRRFEIGTAKPGREDRELVAHHLIDILDPEEAYSAGAFARRATQAVGDVTSRRRTPIVVGGSGLYLRALFAGLSSIPPVPDAVRESVRRRLEAEGPERLHRDLRERDPRTAETLHHNDRQRIARAYEVLEATGRTLTSWREDSPSTPSLDGRWIGLTLPRNVLYDRIDLRARRMLELGWLEEVKGLLDSGVSPSAPAFQAIGYRQLVAHVQGRQSLDAAMDDTIRETRRYAKRQETWFRKEKVDAWFPSSVPHGLATDVLTFLRTEIEG